MALGVVGYTLLISQLTSIVWARDRKQALLQEKLDALAAISKQYGVGFELNRRLRQSLLLRHLGHTPSQHEDLLADLPPKLRVELAHLL